MKNILILSLLLLASNVNAVYHDSAQCPEKSGTWYDPGLAGEGITVQQIDANKLALFRYHAWPIFNYKTGAKISTVGGYATGVLTRQGQHWKGIITAYKGSEGTLLWQDALIGISSAERTAAQHILGQPVQYKVSGLNLNASHGSIRITVLSPYPSIPDQAMHFQLQRLITPDCWNADRNDRVSFKQALMPTDQDFDSDIQMLRSAISRMVRNIIYVLY